MVLLAFLLTIQSIIADTSPYIKYGVGVFNSSKYKFGETKALFLGLQQTNGMFLQQVELGGWVDNQIQDGRKGSFFGNYALGISCNPEPILIQSTIGAGLMNNTDSYLGGNAQFTLDTFIGFKDKNGSTWGADYKHISCAGLCQPNQGRDFLMLRVSVPFFTK